MHSGTNALKKQEHRSTREKDLIHKRRKFSE